MGIPLWVPRAWTAPEPEPQDIPLSPAPEVAEPSTADYASEAPFDVDTYNEYAQFQTTVVPDLSELFNTDKPTPQPIVPKASPKLSAIPSDCSKLEWPELEHAVSQCQLCELNKTRHRTVFGVGHQQAQWMVIGEAPGAEEDKQGEPFVGRAGQLLNNMLASIGLSREQIYIANILKCRPPNNRDPKPDEALLCRGYLERQIALVKPELILVVGRIAAHNLLHTTQSLAKLRGQLHYLPNTQTPVVVTYHPAYLLRQPQDKRKAWQDLQFARRTLSE